MRALLLLLCVSKVFAEGKDPKIIIVGAGPSGIAAASKLLQNGITDVTILEAEGRIGGRVNSTKFGEYWIDLGGQWLAGEKNNAAYDLAAPLGLISKAMGPGRPDEEPRNHRYYTSGGEVIMKELGEDFFTYAGALAEDPMGTGNLKTGSFGEHVDNKLKEYYNNYTETITPDMRKGLSRALKLALQGSADSHDVSLERLQTTEPSEGYTAINWKDRTYGTVLEILMKKIPNPEEELPIMNKTLLNKKVTKIKYDDDGPVKVTTADGSEYTADHVISTVSLGVMKVDHEKIFEPALPEKNKNSIENLGFGRNAKIMLYYDEPWWDTNEYVINLLIWSEPDRKEIENDPEKSWMLGVAYSIPVEYKPKLLFLWMSGPYCEQMEKIPDELFKNQTLGLIGKFFGSSHNLTQPKDIIRTRWNTNENFRGTFSYPAVAAVANNASPEDLRTPVIRNDKPIVQFAGEATDSHDYGSVHGAIASGWREADRLINLYKKRDSY